MLSRVTITSSLHQGSHHASVRVWNSVELIYLPRSEVGNYDRVVIQEILKEIAQTQQVDVNARHRFKGISWLLPPPRLGLNLSDSGHYQRS